MIAPGNHIATVRQYDPATGVATVVVPALYGDVPVEARPFMASPADVENLPSIYVGNTVIVFYDGGDPVTILRWYLPGVRVEPELYSPVGVIQIFGGAVEPNGWIFCRGQPELRSAYPKLFAVISTRFGAGDGSTTFNMPDMRGQYPIGVNSPGQWMSLGVGERYGSPNGQVIDHAHGMKNHVHHINHYHVIGGYTGDENQQHYHLSSGTGPSGEGAYFLVYRPGAGLGQAAAGGDWMAQSASTHWNHRGHQHTNPTNTGWQNSAGSGGVGSPDYGSTGNSFGPNDNTSDAAGVAATNTNLPPSVSFNYIIRAV